MEIDEFRNYCLSKPQTTEEFPFDEDVLVFKVAGKMYALTSLKKWEEGDHSINLKCVPDKAIELREKYPDEVLPGYHMDKKHWNSVTVNGPNLSLELIKQLINHSYDLVVSKLPKKKREEIQIK
ncbi:MmcQ/YjbR family DNA-binding protein [Psychroflexus planctonicus]|uniref:MmcQ-like protein n=1 Tax=Psychroflexus planctonicus TaxID=1526575 RepID=A0ABQ1SGB2_9FLAO|nr:MmcQ/YjbR family DNA-binding protein [Psychroflexus planctonicus]GGE32946.1 hypothetical protein GCM10010832_11470 [Psychroflexus planctonicus]